MVLVTRAIGICSAASCPSISWAPSHQMRPVANNSPVYWCSQSFSLAIRTGSGSSSSAVKIIRMVASAAPPTSAVRSSGVISPPSLRHSSPIEMSHSFSDSMRVPSISHSTALMRSILSEVLCRP
ncbi:Uncharacterised protein [Mycobacteroides abscessus subsp. abscessus]|nr:Uncharacterised protein [Mycobacteroides abscessus subsp. abscessus]SKZ26977.1 Uncharacterised protein [Mycobacteroides abscessus subsp. abscessus]